MGAEAAGVAGVDRRQGFGVWSVECGGGFGRVLPVNFEWMKTYNPLYSIG